MILPINADSSAKAESVAATTQFMTGRFAIGAGRFLPWQVHKALPEAESVTKNGKAASARGTILLFNDWGVPFDSDQALLAALSARGFYIAGYDWYRQGSRPQSGNKANRRQTGQNRYACRFNSKALDCFVQTVLLPDYPAPFYVLAQGLGGLFALTTQNILRSTVRRMVLVAVPMSIGRHRPNSLYHFGIKAASLLTCNTRKHKETGRNSLAYKANLLDHAAYILSGSYRKNMTLPCLLISAACDTKANIAQARLLAEKLRLIDNLIIPAASPALLQESAYQRHQFWAAFDAFIPGSDTGSANPILEHAALL